MPFLYGCLLISFFNKNFGDSKAYDNVVTKDQVLHIINFFPNPQVIICFFSLGQLLIAICQSKRLKYLPWKRKVMKHSD